METFIFILTLGYLTLSFFTARSYKNRSQYDHLSNKLLWQIWLMITIIIGLIFLIIGGYYLISWNPIGKIFNYE